MNVEDAKPEGISGKVQITPPQPPGEPSEPKLPSPAPIPQPVPGPTDPGRPQLSR